MNKKILLLFPIFLILLSCNQEKELSSKKYFDLKGFSDAIITNLSSQKPEVTKVWQLGNQKETKTTNDINWERELGIFKDADLNKSAFVNSYNVIKSRNSEKYELKTGETLPVKKMNIESLPEIEAKLITVETSTSNYLFKTNSEISLKTKNGKLLAYSVFTIQKLFFSKPDTSIIKGAIISL